MQRGILLVESRPATAERSAEYQAWYDEVHIPQLLGFDGFVSVRRFAPATGDGPYVAVYELEAEDVSAAYKAFLAAAGRGEIHMSDALQTDPPPTTRLLMQTSSYPPR